MVMRFVDCVYRRNFMWMPLNVIDLLCEYGVAWDAKSVDTDIGNDEVDWVYWLEDEHAEKSSTSTTCGTPSRYFFMFC